jgi:predicted flap endonuclease-1-like 5' DNA nuclease
MQGDFSRDTFDARHQFSRVLMQQGRVLLDADWNEQAAIHHHYLRSLAADLIGPHGGPGGGFRIRCRHEDENCDFTIGWGHYYVDGILVENPRPARYNPAEYPAPLHYGRQPDYPLEDDHLNHGTDYLVYLDVWERHLSYLEADHIREVALGGPDTATRAQVVWQVKVVDESECDHTDDDFSCEDLLHELIGKHASWLRARARVAEPSDDPCIIPPEARYRGAENQLYRVEIHAPGGDGSAATFKWSRDNGSVVFAIRDIDGGLVALDTLGPDERRSLKEGDWVEVTDDDRVLLGEPGVPARVDAVDRVAFTVTLVEYPEPLPFHTGRHPLLRRWDHGSAPIPVQPGKWIDLEDGVQVWFEPNGTYRTGDYWMIPARTAIGDILWPTEAADGTLAPAALPPHGIVHHYAPLARIRFDDGEDKCEDCRCVFEPHCPSHRLEDVYFAPKSRDPRDEMDDVLIANADVLRALLEADPGAEVRVIGHAPASPDEAAGQVLAERRAEAVRDWYVGNGIAQQTMTVGAKLAGSADPFYERHRVVTRFIRTRAAPPSEQPAAGEVAGIEALMRIAGVGRARAEKFLGAGQGTPADVAAMSVEEIKALLDVTEAVAASIRDSARAKA